MKFYFLIQFKRFYRKLSEMGLSPILGILLLVVSFIGGSVYLFQKTEFAAYIYTFIALTILGPLGEKQKNNFLKLCYPRIGYYKIRLLENLLILTPFILFLLIHQNYLISFVLIFLSSMMAFIPLHNKWSLRIPSPYSKYPFEFSMGFRKLFLMYPALFFLVYKSIEVGNFNLGIFSIGITIILQMSYYFKPEKTYYVWIYAASPSLFLWKKIKGGLLFSSLSLLPILLLIGFTFQEQYLIILGIFFMNALLIATIILAKYSAFPNEMSLPQWVLFGFSIWFPPILIIAIIYFYKQSIKKLKPILI